MCRRPKAPPSKRLTAFLRKERLTALQLVKANMLKALSREGLGTKGSPLRGKTGQRYASGRYYTTHRKANSQPEVRSTAR